jgi:hypothetical protein
VRADWNGEADARLQDHCFLARSLLAPHFAEARYNVPDLFDGAMDYRLRDLACAELEMGHAPAWQAQENANVGPVGGNGGRRGWQPQGGEGIHRREMIRVCCGLTRGAVTIDKLGGVSNMGVHPEITWLAANDAVTAQEPLALEAAALKDFDRTAV